jgi:hypothetical protein
MEQIKILKTVKREDTKKTPSVEGACYKLS